MCVVVVVYTASYRGRPAAIETIDAVADTDAQPLARLVKSFAFDSIYGDATREIGRGIDDIIQAHKVKHLLYAVVGNGIYRALGPLTALGLTEAARLRAINALLSALNVALFAALLRALGVPLKLGAPLILLFAFSASPWIVGAVPESWTLSATVVLATLVLTFAGGSPWLVGAVIGLGMLNNFLLAGLALPFCVEALRLRPGPLGLLRRVGAQALAVALTGTLTLALASWGDPALRPDRYFATLRWFRVRNEQLLRSRGETGAVTLSVARLAAQNALVASVVVDQDDIDVPVNAVEATARQSVQGLAGTVAWLTLALGGLLALAYRLGRGDAPDTMWRAAALSSYAGLQVFATFLIFWPSEFLYSVPVVPVLLALVGLALMTLRFRVVVPAAWVATGLIVLANADQVSRIRRGLAELPVRRPSIQPTRSPASPATPSTAAMRRIPMIVRACCQREGGGGFIIA